MTTIFDTLFYEMMQARGQSAKMKDFVIAASPEVVREILIEADRYHAVTYPEPNEAIDKVAVFGMTVIVDPRVIPGQFIIWPVEP